MLGSKGKNMTDAEALSGSIIISVTLALSELRSIDLKDPKDTTTQRINVAEEFLVDLMEMANRYASSSR